MKVNVLKSGDISTRMTSKEAFQLLYILDCDYNKSKSEYISMKGNVIDKEMDRKLFDALYKALTEGIGEQETEDVKESKE